MILPNVLTIQIQTTREEIERAVPYRNIAYRVDHATLGRTLRISGEIREVSLSNLYMRIEQLRRLNDGVARSLDLEDGTTSTFDAKLVDPEYTLGVSDHWFEGKYHAPYMVSLLEVA